MKLSILSVIIFMLWFHCGICQTISGLPPGFNSAVRTMYYDSSNNYLYVGGNFWELADGTNMKYISRWDGNQWDSLGNGIIGLVYSIIKYDNDIYIGGSFAGSGNILSKAIMKWNGVSWEAFGNIDTNSSDYVKKLNVINNELYVVGRFDSIGNISANGVGKYDGQTWSSYPNLDLQGSVGTVALFNNELYVGGNFSGGPGMNDIAKFDGTNWVSVGGGLSGPNSIINDMTVFNGELYVCGYFLAADGDPGNLIAKWNGSNWSSPGSGFIGGSIFDMHIFNNELYVGGNIIQSGSIPINFNAKWNGANWSATGANFDNGVGSIISNNNDLYFGGGFLTANNDSVFRIAKFTFPTSTNEPDEIPDIKIAPNPNQGVFTLQYNSKNSLYTTIEITDVFGSLIYTFNLINYKEDLLIDLSKKAKGVYFLKVISKNNITTTKVIVE